MKESSAQISSEIYGEVLKDIDGNEYFEPKEFFVWVGSSHIVIPINIVMDLMSDDMKNIVNGKAMENFKKEHSEF